MKLITIYVIDSFFVIISASLEEFPEIVTFQPYFAMWILVIPKCDVNNNSLIYLHLTIAKYQIKIFLNICKIFVQIFIKFFLLRIKFFFLMKITKILEISIGFLILM